MMTERQLMRRAVQLWAVPGTPRTTRRHNQRAWLRAVQRLGDRWLLAQPVERKSEAQA